MVLDGEEIAVDGFGFRDRSWGPRPQVGPMLVGGFAAHGGYSYATASEADAFHTITMDWGEGCRSIHGFLLRDGERRAFSLTLPTPNPVPEPTATALAGLVLALAGARAIARRRARA